MSRLLSGKRNASQLHVAALLALCRVTGTERDRLLALCQDQCTPGWLQQHGSRLPRQIVTLIDPEDKAVAISAFQSMLVPGLLQTGDYTRALLHEAGRVPVAEIEDRVVARLARQSLFSRNHPARFTFYLHEFVLRLPIGGPVVMSEQLPEPDGIVWHTSSYSSNGGDCVEVGWRTSSYSSNGGDCVEVAPAPEGVLVRDSKDRTGPALAVSTPTWRAFRTTLTPCLRRAGTDLPRLGDWRFIGVFSP